MWLLHRASNRGTYIAPTSPSLAKRTPQGTCCTNPAVEDPPAPPFLRRPPEGRCGGEGEVVLEPGEEELDGHPAATRLPPNKICCGRGGNTALLFPSNNARFCLGEIRGCGGWGGAGPLRRRAWYQMPKLSQEQCGSTAIYLPG